VDSLLKIFLPSRGQVNLQKVKKVEDGLFEVPTEDGIETVEMNLLHCSCGKGRLCSHLSAVIHKFHTPSIPYPFNLQSLFVDLAGSDALSNPTVKKNAPHKFLLPKLNVSKASPLVQQAPSSALKLEPGGEAVFPIYRVNINISHTTGK